MKALKVEYSYRLYDGVWGPTQAIPVVRLEAVDAVLTEAVWAMELVFEQALMFNEHTAKVMTDRSHAFLASPMVAAWRERQKKETA
jgi:hypothetical protein